MQALEQDLSRWQDAGVIDTATADRIRAFEAEQARPAGHRWQVLIALILGGILLGAGVLLFVAAHWDQVSPMERLALVVGMLALLQHAKMPFPLASCEELWAEVTVPSVGAAAAGKAGCFGWEEFSGVGSAVVDQSGDGWIYVMDNLSP